MVDLPRIGIVHIPKTAGTWLRNSLIDVYGWRSVCPYVFEGQYPENRSELESYRIISGHFGYRYASRLGVPLVTVLRDPYDRLISLYYYWREVPGGSELAKRFPFEEFLGMVHEPEVLMNVVNTQTYQIALGHRLADRARLASLTPDEVLSKAKENLEKFSVVGITEDIPALTRGMREVLGIPIGTVRRHDNKTGSRPKKGDMDQRLIEKMTPCVELDVQLYEWVASNYREEK